MTHGRIYKIRAKGTPSTPPADLSKKASRDLVLVLQNNNPWWHRTALRLLAQRHDRSVAPMLEETLSQGKEDTLSLRGLWGLYGIGAFDETVAATALAHPSPWLRSWAVRLLGEAGQVSAGMLEKLTQMAQQDQAPEVRLQLASTAGRLTGQDTVPLLRNLMQHQADAHDLFIPLMIWLAYEPRVANGPDAELSWLKEHASGNPLITEEIVARTVRRLAAIGKPVVLAATWKEVFAVLLQDSDSEVQRLARRLAVNFQDPEAVRRSLAVVLDKQKPIHERVDAVRDLGIAHPAEALGPLQDLLLRESDADLRCEICRALGSYDKPEVPRAVLAGWKSYPSAVRAEAVNVLAGRREWARQLLVAVGNNEVARTDLNDNTILRLRALRDKQLNSQIEAVWGKVRDSTTAELDALIARMRTALFEGRGSMERGRKVFENQCAKCHKFEGKGYDVGPDLDGAARDIDYLLVNVLDPNRVVGQPYFTRFVVLKNGRVETGLLAAEDRSEE